MAKSAKLGVKEQQKTPNRVFLPHVCTTDERGPHRFAVAIMYAERTQASTSHVLTLMMAINLSMSRDTKDAKRLLMATCRTWGVLQQKSRRIKSLLVPSPCGPCGAGGPCD